MMIESGRVGDPAMKAGLRQAGRQRSAAGLFVSETKGGMTIYMLIMSILLFGLLGLVVDSSRTYVAHSNAQNYIDHMVLAAANELDGEPGARARAMEIINSTLLDKKSSIIMGEDDDFGISSVFFLSGPPDTTTSRLDYTDFQHLEVTDADGSPERQDELATHILVVSDAREVPWGPLGLMLAGTGAITDESKKNFKFRNWAAARLVERSCVSPLLTVVIPSGSDPSTFVPGSQMRLSKNRDGEWSFGEYGVVSDIPDDVGATCSAFTGSDALECLLALDERLTQCGSEEVSFEGDPMLTQTIIGTDGTQYTVETDAYQLHQGLNTRFGIFDQAFGGYVNSTNVSADTNHIDGSNRLCNGDIDTATSLSVQALPESACIDRNDCSFVNGAVTLDELNLFWDRLGQGSLPPVDFKGEPFETRYDVYLHMIAIGLVDPATGSPSGPMAACHPVLGPTDTTPNRRAIPVALVEEDASMTGVTQSDVEVAAYATVFLTEAVTPVTPGYVADFDGMVDVTPEDGVDNPIQMLGGDVVSSVQGPVTTGSPRYYDPYAQYGMTVLALADHTGSRGFNHPMLYDTRDEEGEDPDLTSTAFGNVLIIDEMDNATNPDDHAQGGMLIFQFDVPTIVHNFHFFDGEEHDNTVRVYKDKIDLTNIDTWTDSDELIAAYGEGDVVLDVPVIGDHAHRRFEVDTHPDYLAAISAEGDGGSLEAGESLLSEGVQTVIYHMTGSGAIDQIEFENALTPGGTDPSDENANRPDDMVIEFLDIFQADHRSKNAYPVITN